MNDTRDWDRPGLRTETIEYGNPFITTMSILNIIMCLGILARAILGV